MHLIAILVSMMLSCYSIEASIDQSTYTVTVNASCIEASETVTTYWSISEGTSIVHSDWIGIYKAGRCGTTVGSTCPSGSDAWNSVDSSGSSGTQLVRGPTDTGTFLAYYFYKNSYTIKALSAPFNLTSFCSTVNLTVEPQTVLTNETVVVSWNGANTNNVDDWIGFWQIDSSPRTDQNRISNAWAYTYGGMNATHTHPTASGNVTLRVPQFYGIYTIYYCQNNGYNCTGFVTVKIVNPNICKLTASATSTVKHIIIIIPENHSFDSIYGRYCKAATGSKPICNFGPSCCEAAPDKVSDVSPVTLTDEQNLKYDPNHSAACEICEIDNGAMDRYVTGCNCSNKWNFAVADNSSANHYYSWASAYAIADNFFQSAAGASSENDMYFATTKFLFVDNEVRPQDPNLNGARCYTHGFKSYYSTTIADLLNYCGIDWTFYAEGYNQNPTSSQCPPQYYDATDDPFTYFPTLINSSEVWSRNFRDYNDLYSDIKNGTLPAVSYVKGLGIHSEHPVSSTLTAGEIISQNIIDNVTASDMYRSNTVVFIVPDESGGYYDHVSTPPKSAVDDQLYGPRIQFIAVGEQVKRNYISHVLMEPSSLVRFIEWNWLNGTGQLGFRDAVVNNIGDLLDSQKTGVKVPS